MMNKKGVSTVIATVLIILLTVSAFAILSQFLIPWFKQTLADAGDCKDYERYFDFEEILDDGSNKLNYNCYDDSKHLIGFSVKGNAQFKDKLTNLKGFMIVLMNDTGSVSFNVIGGEINSQVWEYKNKGIANDLPAPNDIITYVYGGSNGVYNEAQISSIVTSGKKCTQSDKINLKRCSGVTLS